MAFNAFLKIDGVPGESTDDKHKDWIELLSFSHGMSQPASATSTAGARTAGRCDHQDFSVTKLLDKASPKLALNCSNGRHISQVAIELCRDTGDKQKYMEYKFSDVIVSSVRNSGNVVGGEHLPLEEISFNYGKIEWSYTETDHKTGKAKGDVKAHWDLTTNKGA